MAERKVSPNQEALKTRKRVKKSKPEFARSESWRYVRLKKSWRRPRGLDHKMRRKIKGWPPFKTEDTEEFNVHKVNNALRTEYSVYNVHDPSSHDCTEGPSLEGY